MSQPIFLKPGLRINLTRQVLKMSVPILVLAMVLAGLGFQASAASLPQVSRSLGRAQVETDADVLTVTTGGIARSWRWTGAGLATISLRNETSQTVFPSQTGVHSDWSLPGAIDEESQAELLGLEIREADDDGFSSLHLEVVITVRYSKAALDMQYVIWVFPNAPGLRTQLRVKALPGFEADSQEVTVEDRPYKAYGGSMIAPGACVDRLPLDLSLPNKRVYWGYYNDPGNRLPPSKPMLREEVVDGFPVFQEEVVNWASGEAVEFGPEGVALVKESPKTVNQPGHLTGAFFSGPKGVWSTGWGLAPEEIVEDRFRECWATWTLVYAGGNDGLQLALKQFDAARYPVFPRRDLFILSNTWGPANPMGAQFTSEEFVLKEIAAAGDLGIDVVQIDDGWQKSGGGPGARDFRPKYEGGWESIRAAAEKAGVRLGLWVAIRNADPNDLKWNLDELGFITWKVDYDHLSRRDDHEHRRAMLRDVMNHAPMRTQFTLCPEYDDPRYGWYYDREFGSTYFQNIQEGEPPHLTFVPFQVLRKHWQMARYLPANKLQVLLQNPKRTRTDLSDAHQHGHAYCFAMGLPFVPCFFQSAQFLDNEGQAELKTLIARYKRVREDLFTSLTFPIGTEPNNASWSGFQMVSTRRDGGHVLLFRELHNPDPTREIALKFLALKKVRLTEVPLLDSHPQGAPQTIRVGAGGQVSFHIPSPAAFQLYEYEVVGGTP